MELTLIVAVVLTFFIFLVAMRLHESYVKVTILYDETMDAMSKRETKLENAVIQSIKISEQFNTVLTENKEMCGKDPEKSCSLCDSECLFRKESRL